jgi:dihydrolipoamide dehydrogenase
LSYPVSNIMSYDLLILGSGPGGYVAAIRAAQLGMKVGVIEREKLGGVCLNWGCIPTKALLKSAEIVSLIKHSKEFGITIPEPTIDFPAIIARSRKVADRMSMGVRYLFKKNNIEAIEGTGKFISPNQIEVSSADKTIQVSAPNIIIATGARARSFPGITLDGERIITAREAMTLKELPKHLVIIGAGAIGIEFAYFYHTIGCQVTVLEMMPQILPIEDREVADTLAKGFRKAGIQILVNAKVSLVSRTETGVKINLDTPDGVREIEGDLALVAVGVQANADNIGLESTGVQTDRGWITVDKTSYQTSVPGIYAIGDVNGPPWLAHVASAEGIVCVEHIAGLNPKPINYNLIPGCTYCHPQVGSFGYTQENAEKAGVEVKVGKYPFIACGKAQAIGETDGFVKLIFDAKTGKLLGAHILGSDATEMIAELMLAGAMGATHHDILKTMHAHPTLSEAVMEASAASLGEAIHL